jgi:mediator of RNA polymerase II transcription subunit 12, fungi type
MGWVDHAGQILRILAHFAEPLRHEPSLLPQLDSDAQDNFIGNLYDKFKALEAMQSQNSSARVAGLSIFLARVLQFDLAFIRAWTTKTIDTGVGLLTILFRLAMV